MHVKIVEEIIITRGIITDYYHDMGGKTVPTSRQLGHVRVWKYRSLSWKVNGNGPPCGSAL